MKAGRKLLVPSFSSSKFNESKEISWSRKQIFCLIELCLFNLKAFVHVVYSCFGRLHFVFEKKTESDGIFWMANSFLFFLTEKIWIGRKSFVFNGGHSLKRNSSRKRKANLLNFSFFVKSFPNVQVKKRTNLSDVSFEEIVVPMWIVVFFFWLVWSNRWIQASWVNKNE